ncbi:sulfite exporter TauE/SafE family protein [Sphingomonas sp. H39-1-10]|uniref:sulfite exporter TauE/SafE family protein n=1 Tax=Sphingomonas pollutisoli TaxID=3030829 RepID=UPI0023BA0E2D|nr:sulfite exporter TauE/SafE family protein [Sphingomonas pollutisoli]MDF0491389.1 sulfite exporter TauE/SafE family protein [Sphingomonas pollutisoli]
MDHAIVGLTAFLASALTLYSGFGLGTVLLPAFALFFPVPTAVAATGIVHLLNNIFKGGLVGKAADWRTVLRFGVPAIPAAVIGAWLLARLGQAGPLYVWSAFGHRFSATGARAAIGALMILFALLEMQPWFQRLAAPPRLMPLGGLITGLLGGFSGQQGALRSMFLLKAGLAPPRYIATGVMIAILIDLSRLPTYVMNFSATEAVSGDDFRLVATGTLCAFAGAWTGARYARKATIATVRIIVAGLMLAIGGLLASGILGA